MVLMLKARVCDAETVLQLAGDLDLGTRDQLTDIVTELVKSGQVIRADVAALTFMDSSGISGLLKCKHICEQAGGSFQVDGAHGGVATVLRITGLDRAFSRANESEDPAGDPSPPSPHGSLGAVGGLAPVPH